ncbi:hypothetical protein BaRGS_00021004, partial [Batillaria attramentaria]
IEKVPYQYYVEKQKGNSSYSCHRGEQAHIIQALFTSPADSKVCNRTCKATRSAENKDQCEMVDMPDTEGTECRQRFSVRDLTAVYLHLCGVGKSACSFPPAEHQDYPLSVRSEATVVYLCIPENETINPCRDVTIRRTEQSIMLDSDTLESEAESCHSECTIDIPSSSSRKEFSYNFLQHDQDKGDRNLIEYRFKSSPDSEPEWTTMESYYYSDKVIPSSVTSIGIRFNITHMRSIARLWITMNGSDDDTDTTVVTALVVSMVIVVVLFGVAVVVACAKSKRPLHRHRKMTQQESTSTVSRSSSFPLPQERIYDECLREGPTDKPVDPSVQEQRSTLLASSQTGRDVTDGGYMALQRDRPAVVISDGHGGSHYDHTATVQSSEIYNSLQRGCQRRE